MIKLNKCRTLYKFDEAILSTFSGQSQQTTDAHKEETKEAQKNSDAQTQSENNEIQTSSEAEKANTTDPATQNKPQTGKTNPEENKSETTKKDSSENPENASANTQYLFFDADEFIITTYQNESGWWAGYKDTGDVNSAQKLGYFPSNYVQVIETYEVPTAPAEGTGENVNREEAFTWNDYAKYSYLDDNQILVQERTKKLNDYRAPEHRNQEGILGYKKIKIHESRSHALNPAKGGKVITSQVAIKDQSQTSKAYRQMHHYFDYDAWVEERNKNPVAKAKADPTKKKAKKKTLDW